MKRILAALALLGLSFVTTADSQVVPFPQSLPANTVIGRLGISAGPAQAIPFSALSGIFLAGNTVSVTVYGAKCDGVTNDATAFNAAIFAVNMAGGGTITVPAGTCIVGSALGSSTTTVLSNVNIVGSGISSTTIKLANSSNVNVVDGDSSLFGSASNAGVSFFSLNSLTIDGNKANNTTGSCVAIYGFRFNVSDIRIQNCAEHGLRTEYNGTAIPLESTFSNVLIDTVGKHGWWFNGPHDSDADYVVIVDAGQATNNTWDGILIDTLGNIHARHLHPYHRSTATNRMKFAIEDNGFGGTNISESDFEGANIPAQINSAKNTYLNNSFFAAWNGAGTLIVKQASNLISGFVGDPGAGRPATKGLILGQGADNAAINIIDLVTSGQTLGAVDLTNSAGNNQIRVKGFQTSGPGIVGSPQVTDNVEITITGTATTPFELIQKPTLGVSGSTTPTIGINASVANTLSLFTRGVESMRVDSQAAAINFLDVTAAATGGAPAFGATGGDTNIGLTFSTKGTGSHVFQTNGFGASQFFITHTAGATRNLSVTGSNGGNPTLSSTAGAINLAPNNGHIITTGGSVPTNSACTGFVLGTGSNDTAGRVTYTSATTCTINFGTVFANAPFCQVTPGTVASTLFITTSTTQLAVTFGTAQTAFFYHCDGA